MRETGRRSELGGRSRRIVCSQLRAPSSEPGFTIIELLIAIALMVIIGAAVYFAVDGAFDSWTYCRDQLGLQKVLAETMDRVISGTVTEFGAKDALEVCSAGRTSLEYVPPWVDDTHSSASRDFVYVFNKKMKPGSPTPIGEIRMPETNRWKLVNVQIVPSEDNESTRAKLALSVPESSDLRFVYHPDRLQDPGVVSAFFWDPKTKNVIFERGEHSENISKNFFGVEIVNMKFSYFTNHNQSLTDEEWVQEESLQNITGIQVEMEARLGHETQKLVRFVNLRNAPLRTGYLSLKKGMKINIPDSKHVRTFLVTNISGVANDDVLALEAVPQAGQVWRARFEFEKAGSQKPLVRKVVIEYPPQHVVFSDFLHTPLELGINLLLLGKEGLYDYDDDEDTEDVVLLEGNVDLYVTEMNVKGAGLFVRP